MEKGIYVSAAIILGLILLGMAVSFFSGVLLVPLIPTPRKVREEILALMELKPKEMLIDLGSGDGSFLIEAAKRFKVRGIGYEISPLGIFFSKINQMFKLGLRNDVAIVPSNFLNIPLPKADKIYCYLNTKALKALAQKLIAEDVENSLTIYSYKYFFPDVKYEQKVELSNNEYLFVYKGKAFKE
jgi:hypothetical protein